MYSIAATRDGSNVTRVSRIVGTKMWDEVSDPSLKGFKHLERGTSLGMAKPKALEATGIADVNDTC